MFDPDNWLPTIPEGQLEQRATSLYRSLVKQRWYSQVNQAHDVRLLADYSADQSGEGKNNRGECELHDESEESECGGGSEERPCKEASRAYLSPAEACQNENNGGSGRGSYIYTFAPPRVVSRAPSSVSRPARGIGFLNYVTSLEFK